MTPSDLDVYYDPYDVDIKSDPYPIFARLREEAPLYYNDRYDFYAVSRAEDAERGLTDPKTFISSRSDVLELIKADFEVPLGVFIFEDPPIHTVHRRLVSRVFTPRNMNAIEPQVRDFCARCLDPFVGAEGFDFVGDLGAKLPMRVIGMLLGIPDQDQTLVRDHVDAGFRTEPGQPRDTEAIEADLSGDVFGEYIDWRAEHPSDDLMTQLLTIDFEDETGRVRRLTREEILTYVNIIAGAGNETTTRLIGWTGKVLAEHPDQRRELAENPSLVPQAVEEVLRFEPPAPQIARYVARDFDFHGQTVPKGSALLCLVGSANRDDRRFPNGDSFDIHRRPAQMLTFGFGIHFCLGAALARLEGRVALEEVLKRFPEWVVDFDDAQEASAMGMRGWDRLPVLV